MASEVKANKLSPSSGTDLTLGDTSDTVIVPTGVTLNVVDDLGVAYGGTGLSSFTAGDVLYATGSTTLAKLAKGAAEKVLSMNSGGALPEWTDVDISACPTITAAKGGTGQAGGFTEGDFLYATDATTLAKLAKGTASQTLKMNAGATAPEWATVAAASLQTNVQRKTADYTIVTGDCDGEAHLVIPISAAAADRTITLPAVGATGVPTCVITIVCEAASGATYEVKVEDAGSTELWSGVEKGDFVTLIVSNSAWVVLDHKETYYEHRYLTSNQGVSGGAFNKWDASTSLNSIGNMWDTGNDRLLVPFDCYLYVIMNIFPTIPQSPALTSGFKLGAIGSLVTMFQQNNTHSAANVSGPTPYSGNHRATSGHVAEPWIMNPDSDDTRTLMSGSSSSQFTFRAVRRYS